MGKESASSLISLKLRYNSTRLPLHVEVAILAKVAALLASAFLLCLTYEVPDLGRDAFALGAHARRVFGDLV